MTQIIVKMEGGIIHEIISDAEVEILVLDTDAQTDGFEDGDSVIMTTNGEYAYSNLWRLGPEQDLIAFHDEFSMMKHKFLDDDFEKPPEL